MFLEEKKFGEVSEEWRSMLHKAAEGGIQLWNDYPGRTKEEVIEALRSCANG